MLLPAAAMFVYPSSLWAQTMQESHSGIDFYVGSGISAKDDTKSIPFEAIISKPVIPGLTIGIGGGYESWRTNGVSSSSVPLFLDGKVSFRLSRGISSLGDLRIGYSIGQDTEIKSGKKTYKIDGQNGFVIGAMPFGLRFGLGKCIDLDMAFGVTMMIPSGEGKSQTYFGGRLGFNFHKANKTTGYGNTAKVEKPKIIYPTRHDGFEYGLDFTGVNGYGAGILLGYKVSPNLSFAVGAEITGGKDYALPEWTMTYHSNTDAEGSTIAERSGEKEEGAFGETWGKLFVRGEYRFTDRRISPIARVDIGYRGNLSGGADLRRVNLESPDAIYTEGEKVGGFSAHPAIGLSWRCTKNSCLEAAIGYEMTPGVKSIDKVYNQSGNYNGNGSKHYQSISLKEGGINVSGLTIGISWKHTTKWFSSTKPIK